MHARVAWFYGGVCTPAMSHAVVMPRWRRCTGRVFRGIPLKELSSEGPARNSPRRRCKTLVTPLGYTTQGAVSARCGTGSRLGSPPPHAGANGKTGLNHVLARRARGPGFGDRRPAGPVNTACVIRIEDVRRVWEEEVGGKVPFEVAGGEV